MSYEGNGSDGKHYWLTPPDLMQSMQREFNFDFDPCPYPRPEGFDGLLCEWGSSNYVNPPFHGPTAWVRKAIAESQKGKRVVFVFPTGLYTSCQQRSIVLWTEWKNHANFRKFVESSKCFRIGLTLFQSPKKFSAERQSLAKVLRMRPKKDGCESLALEPLQIVRCSGGAAGLIAGFALSGGSPFLSMWVFVFSWVALSIAYARHFFKGWRAIGRIFSVTLLAALTGLGLYFLWSNIVASDVRQSLTASVELPAPTDAVYTSFTLINGSRASVSYSYYCGIHMIAGENNSGVEGLSAAFGEYSGTLQPGDPSSTQCLAGFTSAERPGVYPLVCADVEFWTEYHVNYIPGTGRKYFRFLGYRDGDTFTWVPEVPAGPPKWSSSENRKYCGKYLR